MIRSRYQGGCLKITTRQRNRCGAPSGAPCAARIAFAAVLAWAGILAISVGPAWGKEPAFQGEFDPCPFTPATRANVAGSGKFAASLDGPKLTITGTFSQLASPATGAHLRMGLAMGVPGPVIADLSVAHEVAGSLSGTVVLSPQQLLALNHSALYIQIDSAKAPEGNLWGWLETHQ